MLLKVRSQTYGGIFGRNTRARMRPPTLGIAYTRRFISCLTSSPRLVWGNPHDTLMNGRLDGVDFSCSVSISLQIMNPINIHRWHAHNRIQKSVMVPKHIVLRSLRSQGKSFVLIVLASRILIASHVQP